MNEISLGQRWLSESEPELGLGLIKEVTTRQVVVLFVATQMERRYGRANAPIRRILFRPGDRIETREGETLIVERVEESGGLVTYFGGGLSFSELDLDDRLQLDSPQERLRVGQWDGNSTFSLRREALEFRSQWASSAARGFVGGRVELLPHQLYISHEVTARQRPRILLADETGLGKTIEAALILHRLLSIGRIHRVLILLPESLVHQWFVEMLRRFHLIFQIIDEPYCKALELSEPDSNPFTEKQLVICQQEWLVERPKRMQQALDAGWDMLIVDEAHHIKEDSPAYHQVAALAKETWGALLLSATPEQLGMKSHFARLHLLEPERYADFDEFVEQSQKYRELASLLELLQDEAAPKKKTAWKKLVKGWGEPALEQIVAEAFEAPVTEREGAVKLLLDRYGIGRVMFRNTRNVIEGFPRRELRLHPLKYAKKAGVPQADFEGDPRIPWLVELLQRHPDDKFLLICESPEKVSAIDLALEEITDIDTAFFHESLTLLQRDRNAVWFSEPEGARLMLCSEIGGEGRNFQFARHLILFDLPQDPELLEQRIGRLDRIGQAESFSIHVPYLLGTSQEVWVRWFHEGLDAFSAPFAGGYRAIEEFGARLHACTKSFFLTPKSEPLIESLIEDSRAFQIQTTEQMAKGRNRLLELSSYSQETAIQVMREIIATENRASFLEFVGRLFRHLGVHIDVIDDLTWQLSPTSRLHESFPWLHGEVMKVTFDRELAIQNETIAFLSPDHPMIVDAMELILGTQEGNCCVAHWPEGRLPDILFEVTFVLEAIAPPKLNIGRFLPPTPLRVVVDSKGREVTQRYPTATLAEKLKKVSKKQFSKLSPVWDEMFPGVVNSAREVVDAMTGDYLEKAREKVETQLGAEIERLRFLKELNPLVTKEEIELAESEQGQIIAQISNARIRLDALRVILKGERAAR